MLDLKMFLFKSGSNLLIFYRHHFELSTIYKKLLKNTGQDRAQEMTYFLYF